MKDLAARFDIAADEFAANYPALYAQARIDLNGMFSESDYPDPRDIRRRFAFSRKIWAMPSSGDFRIELANGESDRIRAEIEAELNKTMKAANRDIAERVQLVVSAMVEKLGAYKPAAKKGEKSEGIFRDSLVENIRDLAAILPSLNVTGDSKLADIGQRLAQLGAPDADQLRESDNMRESTTMAAKAILDDISDFFA